MGIATAAKIGSFLHKASKGFGLAKDAIKKVDDAVGSHFEIAPAGGSKVDLQDDIEKKDLKFIG